MKNNILILFLAGLLTYLIGFGIYKYFKSSKLNTYWSNISGEYEGEVIDLTKVWEDKHWYVLVLEGRFDHKRCYNWDNEFFLISSGNKVIVVTNQVEQKNHTIKLGDNLKIKIAEGGERFMECYSEGGKSKFIATNLLRLEVGFPKELIRKKIEEFNLSCTDLKNH